MSPMTRKIILFLLFSAIPALAQFTTVTGTVVDPNGVPYALGTITPLLVSAGTPTLNGQAYSPPTQPVGLDLSGKFSFNVADNTQLQPVGSKWNFTVCSGSGTVQPAIGKGPVCFTLLNPITISGASQDLSTALNLRALPLTVPIGGGGGPALPAGVAPGSVLVSNGVGALIPPVYQSKAIYDVRDWATCDGIVDSSITGPRGGVTALLNAIGTQEATIRWTGSTTPSAHCRLENTVFGANITQDFSGGGALEMISSTTPVGNAVFVNGTSAECELGPTHTTCSTANATNGSTTLSVTSSNTLLVAVAPYPGFTFKITSVTDNCGDIFYHVQQSVVGQPRNVGLWVASSVIGGTCTITATANGGLTHTQVLVEQFSGMGPVVSPDGQGSCNNADATTMDSLSALTTAGSLLFGYGGQAFTAETCTAGAGFTQPAGLAGQSTNGLICGEYKLSSPGGSLNATQLITSSPLGSWVYCMQPLKVGNATATILGGIIDPDLHQIFFNANGTPTQGVIDFTGSNVVEYVYPEWWGANSTATPAVNTPALQAAVWASFGSGPLAVRSNGSGLNIYNRPLYLNGNYQINAELQFYHVISFKVVCASRLNSGITQTGTNLRIIDGQSIAYGAFYDCGWTNTGSSTNALIDLDFNGSQGNDLRPQFIDFYNNGFFGSGTTDVGVLIAKSGGGSQGSNIYCYDCNGVSFTGAVWQAGGNNTGRNAGRFYAQNALAIGWYGGDIQGSPLYGIAGYGSGYIFAYGTTFENGFSTQTGFDMYNEAGQGPCQMNLVRSESRRLVSCSDLDIRNSGTGDGQMAYPVPGTSTPVGTVIGGDLGGIGWDGRYYKVSIDTHGFNGVGTPTAPIIASSGTATTITDTNQIVSGANTIKTFISPETVTQAVTGSTATIVGTPPASNGTITGSVTSGTFNTANETITQAVTGVTATLQNLPTGTQSLIANNFSGTADNSHIWTGGTSGATYTPTAAPTFSATTMLISAATGAPDNSHNWTGGTSGAVLVPTTAPTNEANYTVNGFTGMLMTLLNGTGKGCYGIVTSNTATSITFSAGLVTHFFQLSCSNPDNTSTYIVQPNWNNGTVVDDNVPGCSPCMTMVPLNEIGIGGGLPAQSASGTLDHVSVPGDQIRMAPYLNTVLKNVQVTRNDWGDFSGGFPQLPQTPHDWDVYNVNSLAANGVSYYQSWSYPFNGSGQRTFIGPFHRDLGTRVLTWSCSQNGGLACLDTWIGGRSDTNALNDISRNVLETGGVLGRASPFGTNQPSVDMAIQAGSLTTGNGALTGNLNFYCGTVGASGTQVNPGSICAKIMGATGQGLFNGGVQTPSGPVSGNWNCTNVTPVTVNANVATDQNLMTCTIPAGTLNSVGKTLRIYTAGLYSTPAASTSAVTLTATLCTVSGCGAGTVITPISIASAALGGITATNDPFNLAANSTTQTAGASSAYEAHGNLTIDISALASAAEAVYEDNNTATVGTIDSTAQLFLQITIAFSNASGSNSATERQLIVDSVN